MYLSQIGKCISGAGFCDGSGQTPSHAQETARSLPATWHCICLEFENVFLKFEIIFVFNLKMYLSQIGKSISGARVCNGSGQMSSHALENARSLLATWHCICLEFRSIFPIWIIFVLILKMYFCQIQKFISGWWILQTLFYGLKTARSLLAAWRRICWCSKCLSLQVEFSLISLLAFLIILLWTFWTWLSYWLVEEANAGIHVVHILIFQDMWLGNERVCWSLALKHTSFEIGMWVVGGSNKLLAEGL